MGCCESSEIYKKINSFYDYENGENITDSKYTDLKGDISVMAINKEGKEQVCIKCHIPKQLWNIKWKITDDLKLVLKDCCYDCYCSNTWKYEGKDRLFVKSKYGKVVGKIAIKEHSSPHFRCEGCKKYLHKIYDIAFDKPINSYPIACRPETKYIRTRGDRVITNHLNSYCKPCLILLMVNHLYFSTQIDNEW